jgi:DNA polymerase III epsilon subunit-like protein
MQNLSTFSQFLNESIKNLTQSELFDWLSDRENSTFIALDTETTGLRGPKQEQLTQVAAVAYKFNIDSLTFNEVGDYNKKIKLNTEIRAEKLLPTSRISGALKFNKYGESGGKYFDEQEVLAELKEFIDGYGDVILLIQNAPFDMPMINVRKELGGLDHEIFDTKDFFGYFLLPTLEKLAETQPEAAEILNKIGRTSSGILPTSSLPKVSAGLGVDPNGAHDALYDCRYMVETLEKALEIVRQNQELDIMPYARPRFATDRYIKLKNQGKLGSLNTDKRNLS